MVNEKKVVNKPRIPFKLCILYSMIMLTVQEQHFVQCFFEDFPLEDLISVATTISKHNLNPQTREDALEIICQHSDCIESVLQKRKITKTYISQYLHKNQVSITDSWDKHALIRKLIDHWNLKKPLPNENLVNFPSGSSQVQNASDEFYKQLVYRFAEWFYSLVNDADSSKLGPEHFFVDSQLKLAIQHSDTSHLAEANTATDVVRILCDLKSSYNFHFLPNLAPDSVKYEADIHGQVMLMVSGTLHSAAGNQVAGLFEQMFLLIRDASDNNNWKIKKSQIMLRNPNAVAMECTSDGNAIEG